MQTYDMTPGGTYHFGQPLTTASLLPLLPGPKALRDDLVLDSTVGKIQSTVIAQGLNLWVRLPALHVLLSSDCL